MKLSEQIKGIKDQDEIVALKTKYGVIWIGKAKFVYGAVTNDAWDGDDIEVIRHK